MGLRGILCLTNGFRHFVLFILVSPKKIFPYWRKQTWFIYLFLFKKKMPTLSLPDAHSFKSVFNRTPFFYSHCCLVSLSFTDPLNPSPFRGLLFLQCLVTLFPCWNRWLLVSVGLCDMSMCCLVPKGVPLPTIELMSPQCVSSVSVCL